MRSPTRGLRTWCSSRKYACGSVPPKKRRAISARYSAVEVNTCPRGPSSPRSTSAENGTSASVSRKSMRARRSVENHHVVTRSVLRLARMPQPTVRCSVVPSPASRVNSIHR